MISCRYPLAILLAASLTAGCSQSEVNTAGQPGNDDEHLERVAQEALEQGATQADFTLEPSPEFADANAVRTARLSDLELKDSDDERVSARFPNIDLIDQHGQQLRFYDDLIRDRVVIISFFYTRCTGSCPMTTVRMDQLRHSLKNEFGDELRLISLTLEPEVDTPEELREYMHRYRIDEDESLPKWTFACGEFEELEQLRRALGVYDLDPIIDADKTEHAAILTFGNDRTNRWAALPVGVRKRDLTRTITRIAGNSFRQRYSEVVLLGRTPHGHLTATETVSADAGGEE